VGCNSATGTLNVVVNFASSEQKSKEHVATLINAKGHVDMHAKNKLRMQGAFVDSDTAKVKAKELNIVSEQDRVDSESEGFSIGTSGVSVSSSESRKRWVNQQSGIHGANGLELDIERGYSKGGRLSTNQGPVNDKRIIHEDLHDSDTSSGFNLSVSLDKPLHKLIEEGPDSNLFGMVEGHMRSHEARQVNNLVGQKITKDVKHHYGMASPLGSIKSVWDDLTSQSSADKIESQQRQDIQDEENPMLMQAEEPTEISPEEVIPEQTQSVSPEPVVLDPIEQTPVDADVPAAQEDLPNIPAVDPEQPVAQLKLVENDNKLEQDKFLEDNQTLAKERNNNIQVNQGEKPSSVLMSILDFFIPPAHASELPNDAPNELYADEVHAPTDVQLTLMQKVALKIDEYLPLTNQEVNFLAGMGDMMTFGLSKVARAACDIGNVDTESKAYFNGQMVGITVDLTATGVPKQLFRGIQGFAKGALGGATLHAASRGLQNQGGSAAARNLWPNSLSNVRPNNFSTLRESIPLNLFARGNTQTASAAVVSGAPEQFLMAGAGAFGAYLVHNAVSNTLNNIPSNLSNPYVHIAQSSDTQAGDYARKRNESSAEPLLFSAMHPERATTYVNPTPPPKDVCDNILTNPLPPNVDNYNVPGFEQAPNIPIILPGAEVEPQAILPMYKKSKNNNKNDEARRHAPEPHKTYHAPPKSLPGFPDAVKVTPKSKIQGSNKPRERWETKKGKILEWDGQHREVEMYDKTGKKHLGAYDPITGKQIKPAVKGRRVEK
jgi:hypothetical protein